MRAHIVWAPWLAVGASSALLFVVQPLVTKMLLPGFGGAAATWAVVSLFFQVLLLFGYMYAIALRRLPSRAAELTVHGIVSLIAVATTSVDMTGQAADPEAPVTTLLRTLGTHAGAPLLVLCATGPLLQTWWRDATVADMGNARTAHPLALLAVGSLGSVGSVLAYVWFLEPRFDSDVLGQWWQAALAALLLLVLWCGALLRPSRDDADAISASGRMVTSGESERVTEPALRLPARLFLQWTLLAAYVTALMLATTAHLSHDIASVPMLWIGPLIGFLIAYALAFSPWRDLARTPARWLQLVLTPLAIASSRNDLPVALPTIVLISLHLLTSAVVTLVAVTHLSALRGDQRHLGTYNIALAFGGALGGFFVAILAPQFVPVMVEYPLLLLAGVWAGVRAPSWRTGIFFVACCVLWLDSATQITRTGTSIFRARSFFGAYNVRRADGQHLLYHGTTLHGRQHRAANLRRRALSYYLANGPLGRLVHVLDSIQPEARRVLVVGLGTGAMSCTLRANDHLTFLEIDPLVVSIARDTALFTYLSDCAPKAEIIVGDARVSMRQLRNQQYDLIVLDAFSSDAVPVHLLTVQAYREYAALLTAQGVILTHVSNRYLTLHPVVNHAGSTLGLHIARGDPTFADLLDDSPERDASWWVALTPSAATHTAMISVLGWTAVDDDSPSVEWTDRRSSLLDVISKRQ